MAQTTTTAAPLPANPQDVAAVKAFDDWAASAQSLNEKLESWRASYKGELACWATLGAAREDEAQKFELLRQAMQLRPRS